MDRTWMYEMYLFTNSTKESHKSLSIKLFIIAIGSLTLELKALQGVIISHSWRLTVHMGRIYEKKSHWNKQNILLKNGFITHRTHDLYWIACYLQSEQSKLRHIVNFNQHKAMLCQMWFVWHLGTEIIYKGGFRKPPTPGGIVCHV